MFCAAKLQKFSDLLTVNFKNYGSHISALAFYRKDRKAGLLQYTPNLWGFLLKPNLFAVKGKTCKPHKSFKAI